jgi:hypothetical protein
MKKGLGKHEQSALKTFMKKDDPIKKALVKKRKNYDMEDYSSFGNNIEKNYPLLDPDIKEKVRLK